MATERFKGEAGNSTLGILGATLLVLMLATGRCSAVSVEDPDWPEADCPADQDEAIVTIPSGGTYSVEVARVFGRPLTMAELYREGVESGIGATPRQVERNAHQLQPGAKVTVCK